MARRGKMWNYFTVVDKSSKKAECNYCKKCLSYKTTISNLKNHLKQKHLKIFVKMCRDNTRNEFVKVTGIAEPDDNAGGSRGVNRGGNGEGAIGAGLRTDGGGISPLGRPGPSNCENPPKRPRVFASHLSRPLSTNEKTNLDKLLLNMIANDCQPFSIVHDEGFKLFVHGLNPNYTLPDRKTLSTTLLLREYEERLATIRSIVKTECISLCITVECWTSKTMEPYIAISGHFINKSTLELKSMLLQCSHLGGNHTGENIAEAISLAIKDWDLVGKINFFVTDNASNMQSAATKLQYPHFGCYAHKLNLVAQNALAVTEIDKIITKIRITVAHFKRSSLAKEKLLKYQINSQGVAEESAMTLIISVPTRWNSTFLMLQRFLQLQKAIRATVPKLNVVLPILPLEEWKCLEEYCEVLKPLYEATLIMSSENYLTASKAIVITQGLLNIYEKMLTSNNYYKPVQVLIENINLGLKNSFADISKNRHITVCTFLDPRFKQYAFDEETLLSTKSYIVEQICEVIGVEELLIPKLETPIAELSLWNEIDQKILAFQQPHSAYDRVQEEVDMYLKQAVIRREDCPLQWWRGHKTIYPSLFTMFLKYCNIIVTSVPCERAFSKAGHIISDRRTRLTSSKVAQLMFLHGNKSF